MCTEGANKLNSLCFKFWSSWIKNKGLHSVCVLMDSWFYINLYRYEFIPRSLHIFMCINSLVSELHRNWSFQRSIWWAMKKYLREDWKTKKDRNGNQRLWSVSHLETYQWLRTKPQESMMQKTSKLRKSRNMEIAGTQFLISQFPQHACGIDRCRCN